MIFPFFRKKGKGFSLQSVKNEIPVAFSMEIWIASLSHPGPPCNQWATLKSKCGI